MRGRGTVAASKRTMLVPLEPTMPLKPLNESMLWTMRLDDDPGHRWLRRRLQALTTLPVAWGCPHRRTNPVPTGERCRARATTLRRREPSVHARADPIEEINASLLTRTVSRCARALLRSVSTASNGAVRRRHNNREEKPVTSTDAVAKADAVKEYFAAFNRRDFETMTNMLAPDFVFEHESPIEGRDKVISVLQGACTAFPDLAFSVTDQVSSEDEVVCFLLGSGTWQGEYFGVQPTGRHFAARTVDRIRFSGASIASISTTCEVLGGFSLMHQLGIAEQLSKV